MQGILPMATVGFLTSLYQRDKKYNDFRKCTETHYVALSTTVVGALSCALYRAPPSCFSDMWKTHVGACGWVAHVWCFREAAIKKKRSIERNDALFSIRVRGLFTAHAENRLEACERSGLRPPEQPKNALTHSGLSWLVTLPISCSRVFLAEGCNAKIMSSSDLINKT